MHRPIVYCAFFKPLRDGGWAAQVNLHLQRGGHLIPMSPTLYCQTLEPVGAPTKYNLLLHLHQQHHMRCVQLGASTYPAEVH